VTGTTPLIIAAESAVGIKEGGRTGLVAVTVAGCFMCSMFLAPFMQVGSERKLGEVQHSADSKKFGMTWKLG
jgi:xanthine/uracil/vitamin C permease (AzgA family)